MAETEADLKSAMLMFNWVEYMVFSSMLILSLLIGVYYGWFKKQDTVAEYMLGGKKMGIFPVTMSLVFSHISGVSLLGVPAEVYSYGTQYIVVLFVNITIVFIVNYIYLPVFFNLQLNSLYEYLELRFNKATRTLASLIFALSLIMFIPVVIYIPALAFNQVTGISVHTVTPIISFICIFYTSFGGLKAVVWTDALQSIFTLGSVIFVIILGVMNIGSISEVFRINQVGTRLEIFNMRLSPFERSTFWTMYIGLLAAWISGVAVHPGAVQRFIAVSTFEESKKVMIWSAFGFCVVKILTVGVGMLLYAAFYNCDPVATGLVKRTGQLLPYYVMLVSKDYPGLTGLFISGVLSAALSTMSASLNTVAGTLYEDFIYFVLRDKKQSDAKQSLIIKLIVLVLGVICTLMVFVVEKLGAVFQMAITLVGVTNGALVGLFTLGILFPRANAKGAICGSLSSLLCTIILAFGAQYYMLNGLLKFPGKITSVSGCPANLTANLAFNVSARVQTYTGVGSPVEADDSVPLFFQLSNMYYITFGTLTTITVGLLVSFMTESVEPRCLAPQLFTPCIQRFLPQQNYKPTNNKPLAEDYNLVKTQPGPEDIKDTVIKNN